MSDIFTKQKRSNIMSKISGKETKPEILVRKYLFSKGFRYRKNVKELSGKPDIVLPKYKTVIFVHGCFWHKHTCKAGNPPTSNIEFWSKKLKKNAERDIKNYSELKSKGWRVVVIWQCEINNIKRRNTRLNSLLMELKELKI